MHPLRTLRFDGRCGICVEQAAFDRRRMAADMPADVRLMRMRHASPSSDEVLRVVREVGPVYCVDIAVRLGCSVLGAKNRLVQLERRGLLESQRLPAPGSGNGRRYYRLPGTAPLTRLPRALTPPAPADVRKRRLAVVDAALSRARSALQNSHVALGQQAGLE